MVPGVCTLASGMWAHGRVRFKNRRRQCLRIADAYVLGNAPANVVAFGKAPATAGADLEAPATAGVLDDTVAPVT